jgi:mono/diheme cytochrome c family protein
MINLELRMKNFAFLLIIAHCLFAFSSCGNNSSVKSAATIKPIAGKNIFEENCTACHGSDGKLCALGAKDLSISALGETQMVEIITNGKNTMTPFGSMLSKEEIESVANYIQTLRK